MPRLNFRDLQNRFLHIDAEFVESKWSVPRGECFLTVRFYPWWEHPMYVRAVQEGTPWGFRDYSEGVRNVTVWALDPLECNLRGFEVGEEITDWSFSESDPRLWPYEDCSDLTINEDFDVDLLIKGVRERLSTVPGDVLWDLVDRHQRFRPPYSTSTLPRTVFQAVRDTLETMKVAVFVSRPPEEREAPILFDIDGDQYIIARDFELDMPAFEHLPEWFRPGEV